MDEQWAILLTNGIGAAGVVFCIKQKEKTRFKLRHLIGLRPLFK